MYARHHESHAQIAASPAAVFALLDDHARLSAHMSKRSIMMGGGKMQTTTDAGGGRIVGSVIRVEGRVFGLRLRVEEVVTERAESFRKAWEVTAEPRLLVIGRYRIGFEIRGNGPVHLTVWIDYDLPRGRIGHFLGRLLSGSYARWCTDRMTRDATRAFRRAESEAGPLIGHSH